MSLHKLNADVRTITGKGPARQARMAGTLPGVAYGRSFEPVKITIDLKEANYIVSHSIRAVELTMGDVVKTAIVKEVQSDPINSKLIHIDFQVVEENESFKTYVPVNLLNKIKSHGVRMGGQLVQHVYKLKVQTDLKNLPSSIDIDIIDLSNQQSSLVRDLKIEGVEILSPESVAICSISKARGKSE